MSNYIVSYNAEQFGGEYIYAQEKPKHDWVSFGLGALGGLSTALWYTGAIAGVLPLVGGMVCYGAAIYLVMPEHMTPQDKFVLAGGVAASGLFGLGVVHHGLGYMLMSGVVATVSYNKDSNDVLKQALPAFVGFNVGIAGGYKAIAFAANAVNDARRESIGDSFSYTPDQLPKGIQRSTGLQIKFHGVVVPQYLKLEPGGTYALKGGRASTHVTHTAFGDSDKAPVNIPGEDGGLIGMLHDLGCWNPFS